MNLSFIWDITHSFSVLWKLESYRALSSPSKSHPDDVTPSQTNFMSKSLFQFHIFPSNPVLLCRILSCEVQFSSFFENMTNPLLLPILPRPSQHCNSLKWAPKNWCFWTMVQEKTLERPLNSKEIRPVNPKGNQSWIFMGRTDAEAEAPILWSPDAKKRLIGKDPDAGKDWRPEEKGTTEDETAGWHHRLNGLEFEQSGSWWWTGKPGLLQSMGSQRVRHDLATEQQHVSRSCFAKLPPSPIEHSTSPGGPLHPT